MTAAGTRILNCSGFGIILPLILGTWTILVLKNVIFAVVNVFCHFHDSIFHFPIYVFMQIISPNVWFSAVRTIVDPEVHIYSKIYPLYFHCHAQTMGVFVASLLVYFSVLCLINFLFVLPNQFQSCKLN